MLCLSHIDKSFGINTPDETSLFNDFNFYASRGEFISIVGSNGSGKTTLLNLICGSDKPDGGSITLNGTDITHSPEFKRAASIGRVFQDPKAGTCADLSVLENMALADNKNKPFAFGAGVNKKRIDYYASLLENCEMGLENKLNVKVGALSGGQRQAIALVIANMTNVKLLILDEHTAALDPKSSETVMELTDKFVTNNKITTIMVTHNLRYAVSYGNRLVMMHEGTLVMDEAGEAKKGLKVEDLLEQFSRISIELGN